MDIDIKLEDANLPSKSTNAGMVIKMKGMEGEKRVSMNTYALETKIASVKLIAEIASCMDKAFAPYVEATLPVIVELMDYKLSKAVRKHALKCLSYMLNSLAAPLNNTVFTTVNVPQGDHEHH